VHRINVSKNLRLQQALSQLALACADRDKRPSDAPSAQHPKEDVMKSKRASYQQQPEPSPVLLMLHNPEDLRREMLQLQLAIARRARELLETSGGEHDDWEGWSQAESELLRRVSVSMSATADRISINADVVGFDETELKVSIEPRRITILGQKDTREMKGEGGPVKRNISSPQQIMEVVDLSTPVMPERAVVKLQGGVLKFELPIGRG
jgi:HSP20 family molecular chaperone IbpA